MLHLRFLQITALILISVLSNGCERFVLTRANGVKNARQSVQSSTTASETSTPGPCDTLDGDGSASSSQLPISDVTEWLALEGQSTAGVYYILCNDLDFTAVTYTPISTFSGTLDGNNKTISHLSYTNADATASGDNQGMFRVLDGATIHDLRIENSELTSASRVFGTLAGSIRNGSLIENLALDQIDLHGNYTIGILGGAIANSRVNGVLITNAAIDASAANGDSSAQSGLIAGIFTRDAGGSAVVDIESVQATGTIQSDGKYVGGAIGIAGRLNLKNIAIYPTLTVTSTAGWVGGLAGLYTAEGKQHENIVISGTIDASSGLGRLASYTGQYNDNADTTLKNVIIDVELLTSNPATGVLAGYSTSTGKYVLDNAFWSDRSPAETVSSSWVSTAPTLDAVSGEQVDAFFYSGGGIAGGTTSTDWKNSSIWTLHSAALPEPAN